MQRVWEAQPPRGTRGLGAQPLGNAWGIWGAAFWKCRASGGRSLPGHFSLRIQEEEKGFGFGRGWRVGARWRDGARMGRA